MEPVRITLGDLNATLFLGDCLELLPTLAAGFVYVTDQPYGTGWVRGGGAVGEFKAKHEKPEWDVWDLTWLKKLNSPKRIAAFCPAARTEELCYALTSPMVMHYRKSNVRPNGLDREPIVVSPPRVPRNDEWKKLAYNGDMPFHPCQKPLPIMAWLLESVSDETETVVDPFMGSGTTGVACLRTGRNFIGIEKDPKHFATAVERLEREARQGVLL
jgi:site-specific DNA-methyltransferase (adenine-specific)/modification methylase